jgi:hypothetical protein
VTDALEKRWRPLASGWRPFLLRALSARSGYSADAEKPGALGTGLLWITRSWAATGNEARH